MSQTIRRFSEWQLPNPRRAERSRISASTIAAGPAARIARNPGGNYSRPLHLRSRNTRTFVRELSQQQAIPSEWAVDNYEDPYLHDTPAVVPETMRNTTTAVGLWLAKNAKMHRSM